jgi:hypothetical protein
MSTWLGRCCLSFALFLCVAPAFAQLAQYGYVVGNLKPEKSYLEKLDEPNKGKYLHYHIFLTTASAQEYEVVIDVNDVSPTKPLIYRLASLDNQSDAELNANFGPVFSATSDFHLISNTQSSYGPLLTPDDAGKKAAGALDYFRHPGLIKSVRNLPWQNMYATTTADPLQWALPKLDALFKPPGGSIYLPTYTKVYVFGAPFTYGGKGMHVVHQNQSDTSAGHAATNATWQDGAVIIERHTYLLGWRVSRQVLMTKFAAQTDFSAESNDLAKPALPGHIVAPTVENFPVGLICGDYQTFGPFSASQLEVATSAPYAEPYGPGSAPKIEVSVKKGAFASLSDPGDYTVVDTSTDASAAGRAFGRAYSPMSVIYFPIFGKLIPMNLRSSYYVRVHAIDPNSYCDSAVGANLRVSRY